MAGRRGALALSSLSQGQPEGSWTHAEVPAADFTAVSSADLFVLLLMSKHLPRAFIWDRCQSCCFPSTVPKRANVVNEAVGAITP